MGCTNWNNGTHHWIVIVQQSPLDIEHYQTLDGSDDCRQALAEVMDYEKAQRDAAIWRELGFHGSRAGCRYSYWNGEHFCTTEHTLDEALRDGDRQNDSADVYGTCVVIGWERAL